MMHWITKIGDIALLLPLSCGLGISLWRWESKEAAKSFAMALVFCLFSMLVLKLGFLSCAENWLSGVNSPSGHTAFSLFAFGSFGMVTATHSPSWSRGPILSAVLALASGIAVSRVAVGSHTVLEVLLGLAVGLSCFVLFARRYARLPHPRVDTRALWIMLVMLILLLHGLQAPAEIQIRKVAGLIRLQTNGCAWLR